jgi:hypothetical protein
MSGVTMEGFAKECTEEVLSPGRVGILVDHPPQQVDGDGKVVPITLSTAQQMGLRPTLQLYTAESIRNWKFARVNNAWVLVQVVLGETAMVSRTSSPPSPRIVIACSISTTAATTGSAVQDRKGSQDVQIGSDIYPVMNGKPLTFIPFMIVGTQGKNDQIDEPPLIDLIDKNVAHYQVNSDHRHGLHTTALPTLFIAGCSWQKIKIRIGGSAAVDCTGPEAKGEFIEYKGSG